MIFKERLRPLLAQSSPQIRLNDSWSNTVDSDRRQIKRKLPRHAIDARTDASQHSPTPSNGFLRDASPREHDAAISAPPPEIATPNLARQQRRDRPNLIGALPFLQRHFLQRHRWKPVASHVDYMIDVAAHLLEQYFDVGLDVPAAKVAGISRDRRIRVLGLERRDHLVDFGSTRGGKYDGRAVLE